VGGGPKEQGVELINQVIERVKADPDSIAGSNGKRPLGWHRWEHPLGAPHPLPAEMIARLTFPSGKPLPPSLQRWLAFDANWLCNFGWFSSLQAPVFTPRRIDALVQDELDNPEMVIWAKMYAPLADRFAECFLLPGGTDSRRIYAVTEPDSLGEYPVLAVDVDDQPYLGIMYPGFDVFMADLTGFGICGGFTTYTSLFEDERYAPRLNEHAHRLFNGEQYTETYG
jgi:hypothetical protein